MAAASFILSTQDEPNMSLSDLLVVVSENPELPGTLIVMGCRYQYNEQPAGDNARLATQRRIELRREYGVFREPRNESIDRDTVLEGVAESLSQLPARNQVRREIAQVLRMEYGCEYTIADDDT